MIRLPRPGGPPGPRAIAAAWALATFVALVALQGSPGISRDEADVIARARRGVAALRGATPPLAPALAGGVHAVASAAGLSERRAYRLGSALSGALLSALLAAAACAFVMRTGPGARSTISGRTDDSFAGPAAAALAPALFWLSPRTLHAGLVATPEILLAALSLAAVLVWRRAVAPRASARRGGTAAAAGLLVGAATLARADAWTLAMALAAHAAAVHVLGARAGAAPRGGAAAARVAAAIGAAAALAAVAWPGVLRSGAGPWLSPPGGAAAATLALLAVPAPLLCAFAGGLAHAAIRIAVAVRSRAPAEGVSDDLLLVLAALSALAGSALAHAPAGARPFLHALPFLALLAARALVRAAGLAWPARRAPLLAALALVVLYPGLRAAAIAFPNGAAAWNELAGGPAGAASRGLRRQDGGEAAAAVLAEVNARAAPRARVWWPGVAPEAVGIYARDRLVRADLTVADRPEEADLAIVPLDGASRDLEYRAWAALRTARPSAGAYAYEVPLAFVYARQGAWR